MTPTPPEDDPSPFIENEDGSRSFTPEKKKKQWRDYLGLLATTDGDGCKRFPLLERTPLLEAINEHKTVLVYPDSMLIFRCHLKAALVLRNNPDLPWKVLDANTLQGQITGSAGDEIQEELRQGWDPLIIDAYDWPRYFKASVFIGALLKTRDRYGLSTLFVVPDLANLPTNQESREEVFDHGVLTWLYERAPENRLTAQSVMQNVTAHDKKLAAALYLANPGLRDSVYRM